MAVMNISSPSQGSSNQDRRLLCQGQDRKNSSDSFIATCTS